jgi:hypothetical protein
MRVAGLAVLLAAAVAAAIAANFVLLGYGGSQDDRVGNLTPAIADVMAGGVGTAATQPPPTVDDDDADGDHSGPGRGGEDDDD